MKDNYDKETDTVTRIQLLEKVFDHLSFGIAIVSPQLDVLEANHQFHELINASVPGAVSQHSTTDSFWEQQDIAAHLTAHFKNGNYNLVKDIEWHIENGTVRYIRIHSQLLQKELNVPIKILLT